MWCQFWKAGFNDNVMAKVIYQPGDIIPIVLNVLHTCCWSYACNAFKIAIKDHFPDLKGTETDILDDASIALLDSVDEGLIPLIRVSIEYFGWVREAIANLYGLDAEQFLEDARLEGLATDFYCQTTIDGFPCDGDPDDYNDAKYEHDLEIYAMSMLNVINWLFILLINGEADLELSFDADHFYMDFAGIDYENEDHSSALAILKEFGLHLEAQYVAIIDYVH
jgi:hypothetical protein